MRETLYTHALPVVALDTAVQAVDGPVNGNAIDLELYGNRFRSAAVAVVAGTITDGTFAFTAEESGNGADWTAVPAERIQGTLPTVTSTDSDTVVLFGVVPVGLRYLRVVCTVSGTTSGGTIGAIGLCSDGGFAPVRRS